MSDSVEQYTAYLKDISNIGSRHETARGFYLTVLSTLIAFLALAGDDGPLSDINRRLFAIVAIAGIAVCLFWFFHTLSYAAIYKVKFRLLGEMEENLPFKLYSAEYPQLRADRRYTRLTYLECGLSTVFALLFLISISFK